MGRYIIKRLLWMIPIILCVAILVFTLMTFCPGDPAAIVLGSSATEEDMNLMRESLGLNRPFLVRLGTYLRDAFLRFDLGRSYLTKVSIADSIREYLPRTMLLTIITMLISVGLALPLGITAATNQGRWQDTVCMVFALIGISVPSFWLALLLILEFSVKHAWLPAMGIGGLKYYILPAISGSLGGVASLARQTRSSMLCGLHHHRPGKGRVRAQCHYQTCAEKCADSHHYGHRHTVWQTVGRYNGHRNDFWYSRHGAVHHHRRQPAGLPGRSVGRNFPGHCIQPVHAGRRSAVCGGRSAHQGAVCQG